MGGFCLPNVFAIPTSGSRYRAHARTVLIGIGVFGFGGCTTVELVAVWMMINEG